MNTRRSEFKLRIGLEWEVRSAYYRIKLESKVSGRRDDNQKKERNCVQTNLQCRREEQQCKA